LYPKFQFCLIFVKKLLRGYDCEKAPANRPNDTTLNGGNNFKWIIELKGGFVNWPYPKSLQNITFFPNFKVPF
jgi:hypothetical protein